MIDAILKKFGYKYVDPVKHDRQFLPEVNNWDISDFIINILLKVINTRPYPLSELQLLASTVCWYRPTHIFEWGTHVGVSARIFYETTKAFKIKSKIISVDLPEDVAHVEHPHDKRGIMVKGLENVELMLGDGIQVSCDYLSKINNSNIRPLFFLDGDHTFKSVYREFKTILNKYPNSAIIIHDTFFQDKKSNYNIGPFLAIKKLLTTRIHSRYHVFSTQFGLPGMTAIIPKRINL